MKKNQIILLSIFAVIVVIGGIFIVVNSSNQNQNTDRNIDTAVQEQKNDEQGSKKDEKCIITISGSEYDVTSLRNTHTGGDIFKCGRDMTRDFKAQHKMNLEMIERYKIIE